MGKGGNDRLKRFALGVLGAYWLALVIGTHVPRPPQVILVGTSDKVLHLGAYAGLAFFFCWNVFLRRAIGWRTLAGAWLAATVFGAVDELTQIPVGRECDFFDWTADALGALAGIAIFLAAWAVYKAARTAGTADE